MKRLVTIALVLAALAAPADAPAALFFLFDRTSAAPNDRVTIRTGGTPRSFTASQRRKPLARLVRLYLVRNELATDVHSRFDSRLAFVGSLVPDRGGRGIATVTVPLLDPGDYTLAYWCPGCAAYSRGRMFFVQESNDYAEPYRSQTLLRVVTTTPECSVTIPNASEPPGLAPRPSYHGNGALWTRLPDDGIIAARPEQRWPEGPPGSIGTKLYWWAAGVDGALSVRGERLDAQSPPLLVHGVNRGRQEGFRGSAVWAAPVSFPTAGCWRIRAQVADVSLSYVVRVTFGR